MSSEDFPPELAQLARAVQSLPALRADMGSVEGTNWRIVVDVEPDEVGWRSLEFLAWAVTDMKRGGFPVALEAASPPPYLNTPGQMLYFVLHGEGDKAKDGAEAGPSRMAELLNEWREDYVAVGEEQE
jgi:hypothetical protein